MSIIFAATRNRKCIICSWRRSHDFLANNHHKYRMAEKHISLVLLTRRETNMLGAGTRRSVERRYFDSFCTPIYSAAKRRRTSIFWHCASVPFKATFARKGRKRQKQGSRSTKVTSGKALFTAFLGWVAPLARPGGLPFMTSTKVLNFLPFPPLCLQNLCCFSLLVRKFGVMIVPLLPYLFGRHIWKPPRRSGP